MAADNGKRGFRLLALLIGIVGGLGAAEIALRLGGEPESEFDALTQLAAGFEAPAPMGDCRDPASQARLREIVGPSPHPGLIYELRPDVDTCFEKVPVKINSRGVRGTSEVAVPKPEGTFRILVLGDSHAFGWAIPETATAAAQLQKALGAITPSPVEVVNAGVPGYSAFQEAAWLEAHGADLEPDCVIVLFVANDLGLPHFLLRSRKPGPSRLWDRVTAATSSKRWFTFAPNELATFVSEVEMERIPPRYRHMVGEAGYRGALRQMSQLARQERFELVNVFDYSTIEIDAKALIGFQEDLGITPVEMPWPMDPSLRISAADPHLNRAGNGVVVESIVRGLTSRSVCLPPEQLD